MKKIIIFFNSYSISVAPTSAQQVKFGVEAGGNWSHYKNDKSKAEQVGSMGGGFQLGGTVDYEFKHHWMLMSGLTWMQTRSSMELFNASVPYFPDTEIKMNHLNIPIKIGYNIRNQQKTSA